MPAEFAERVVSVYWPLIWILGLESDRTHDEYGRLVCALFTWSLKDVLDGMPFFQYGLSCVFCLV